MKNLWEIASGKRYRSNKVAGAASGSALSRYASLNTSKPEKAVYALPTACGRAERRFSTMSFSIRFSCRLAATSARAYRILGCAGQVNRSRRSMNCGCGRLRSDHAGLLRKLSAP